MILIEIVAFDYDQKNVIASCLQLILIEIAVDNVQMIYAVYDLYVYYDLKILNVISSFYSFVQMI